MLIRKFVVPTTRGLGDDIFRCSLPIRRFGSKASCGKTSNIKEELISPKCEEYKRKLAECPKKSHELLCCKKLFPKPEPKCKVEIVGDNFQVAYQHVMNRAKQVLAKVEGELRSVLDQLENDLNTAKSNEEAQLQQLFSETDQKLNELISLDPTFGSSTRRIVLSLNHDAWLAFDGLQRDVAPSVQRIRQLLDALERDTIFCIERAKLEIHQCRKCTNPKELMKCVEENASHAENLLNRAADEATAKLNEIRKYRDEILKCHNDATVEVVQIYRGKTKCIAQYIERCISAIKEMDKK